MYTKNCFYLDRFYDSISELPKTTYSEGFLSVFIHYIHIVELKDRMSTTIIWLCLGLNHFYVFFRALQGRIRDMVNVIHNNMELVINISTPTDLTIY